MNGRLFDFRRLLDHTVNDPAVYYFELATASVQCNVCSKSMQPLLNNNL